MSRNPTTLLILIIILMTVSGCGAGKKIAKPDSVFFQQGIASWYGDKFHGRKTASGEIYDMYAMTAAHKTLPFNTIVEITNISNGLKAVVRINDRGPFVKDRIIDLTYTVAKKLDMILSGTTEVRLRIIGAEKPSENSGVYTEDGFTVQAGSFSISENAQRLAELLSSEFDNVRVIEFGGLFRVFVGKKLTKEKADVVLNRLVIEGHHGLIVKEDN